MFSTSNDDFVALHYQPMAARHGRIVGMEALMRWHHRERGPISPEAFIPIFEHSGAIVPLSRWALGQACRDAASWRQPLLVAVDLSSIQIDEEDLPALVSAELARSGLAPHRLELEVMATALASDARRIAATMTRLRTLGVGLTLADFGAGDAGPTRLRKYPFSKLKIARGLVAGIEASASARSIIHMAVELGHSLGLSVAAEGIETPAQLAFLEDQGCDWMQGYFIGRPAPIEALGELTGNTDRPAGVSAPTYAFAATGWTNPPFAPPEPATSRVDEGRFRHART
ncbi:MAG: EAL domain-containing protein [Devosia nanyangense]|uniref:EAL domain-containing protein n=1 Tax=Devosia nanyangense TaxID=1228055 RepID=A0A933L6V7_9HYPH|nr:EAL domain-containing protein [Devosia nanyangense]